jgi:hypothetical protein
MLHYMLRPDHSIEATHDLMRWATWFETADRHVARTKLLDGSEVSTVFLGIDHSHTKRKPLLFETAFLVHPNTVEPTTYNGRQYWHCEVLDRYSTWAEAEVGHMETVERISARLGSPHE